MRRLSLFICACVALACAACGSSGNNSAGATAKPPAKQCPNTIPFVATYLPPGFSNQLQSGPASGKSTMTNVTIFHYSGQGGQYLEFLRGGKRSALSGTKGIIVLSHLARIGSVPQGVAMTFRLGPSRCGKYQVVLGGLPASAKPGDELIKVDHGLKAAPG
jgi:hypothetical protein